MARAADPAGRARLEIALPEGTNAMGTLDGQPIGFIGLGLMGRPMAENLREAGASLTIFNRSRGVVDELARTGMTPADSPRAVAEAAPVTVLMVSDTPAVEAVMAGPEGVLDGLRPGDLVVDMGTTAVAVTRALGERVRAAGGEYVDAPVSGGEIGARTGTLTIMAGGEAAAVERAMPVMRAMGERITHVGAVGAGQVAKAANQVIVGLTIGAVAEALALARRAGVDPAKVRQALRGGFADSRILELHGERMIERAFAPGGKARTQRKDIAQALELAREAGIDLPALALNLELWDRMIENGWGELDHSALIKLFEPD